MPLDRASPLTIAELVFGLGRLGLLSFGGVGPQAYHHFVERARWLSADEFAELLGLAQALPGANIVNLCAIVGDRWFGLFGAVAAVAAITLPPLVIVIAAAAALTQVTHWARFIALECAVVAASAGLIFATAYRVLATITQSRRDALFIAGAVVVAVGVFHLSMPLVTVAAIAAGWTVHSVTVRH